MIVLITGASGFVGQHLVRRLLAQNCEIVAMDFAPNPALLAEFAGRITFVQADITDGAGVRELIQKYHPTYIAHLAFLLPPETENNPERAIQVNVQGLVNVFEAGRGNQVKRVICTSSMSAYRVCRVCR
ncbi:MAG TPA: NAD(P)-dependent oxidoreductase [Anaerolineae bacterium]|nr:NAD(P)-dependent oxidoreductase [Anaerolineae bacterium]